MKKAVAIVTCLITLGPAAALADSYRHTTVVVNNYHSQVVDGRVVREVVRVRSHQARNRARHDRHRIYNHGYNVAHHGSYNNGYDRAGRDEVVYGRVLSVEPVYRVTPQHTGHDSCVRYVDDGPRYRSHTSTVLGAVIGAAVGHRIGDSHGDPTAAAIAGGVLGASIGRDVGSHVREGRRLVVDGPCRPSQRQYQQREVVEYVVRYRYNGEVYRTRLDHDPGEWIALDVDINPA